MAGPASSNLAAAPTVPDNPAVFISYAREDQPFVERLTEALQLKGLLVSGDWQLVRGENYDEQLQQLQLGTDAVLCVLSPDSVESLPCRVEIDRAVEQRKRLIPVVCRDLGGNANAVAPALALPQWTFLRATDDFVTGVQAVVEAINTDFDLLPQHRRLLQAAENWQRNGRSVSYLLRKDGLTQGEAWLMETARNAQKLPKPTPLQLDYIHASQAARTRGTQVRFVVVACIAVVLGVLAIAAVLQTREARRQRDEAEAATETARAARAIDLANQPGREMDALAEAVAATFVRTDSAAALRPVLVESLATAVNAATSSMPLVGHLDEVDSAAFSPDGTRVLTKSKDMTEKLWDAADGRLIASFSIGTAGFGLALVSAASFSCDSRLVITVLNSNDDPAHRAFGAEIWDARTGAHLVRLAGHTDAVYAASFSPDSTKAVTASADKRAWIWNVAARDWNVAARQPVSVSSCAKTRPMRLRGLAVVKPE